MAVDNLLDLKRGNVFAPAPHKVVFAIHEEKVAVVILISEVATANPAPTGFLCCRFRIFIIFGQGRTSHWPVDQFAHGSWRQLTVLLVHNLYLVTGTWLTHGANFPCSFGIGV